LSWRLCGRDEADRPHDTSVLLVRIIIQSAERNGVGSAAGDSDTIRPGIRADRSTPAPETIRSATIRSGVDDRVGVIVHFKVDLGNGAARVRIIRICADLESSRIDHRCHRGLNHGAIAALQIEVTGQIAHHVIQPYDPVAAMAIHLAHGTPQARREV